MSGNNNIFTGMAELEVRPSPDSLISIQVIREALGADQRDAIRNLNQIPYSIMPDTGSCVIAGTFSFEDAQGWRNQRLKYIVRLPESYTLILNKMSARILTDPEELQSAGSLQLRNVGGRIKSSRLPSANAGHAQGGHTLDMMQYRPINLLTCMLDLIF
ncbi:MAG: hypothetical protein IH599_05540 [Bacteroidales bacterium]|nr:hypothetical protein [Bacteroidales bacterium]